MLTTMPNVFSAISSTQLTVTHTADNFADRLTLFGTTGTAIYKFKGTLAGNGYTPN